MKSSATRDTTYRNLPDCVRGIAATVSTLTSTSGPSRVRSACRTSVSSSRDQRDDDGVDIFLDDLELPHAGHLPQHVDQGERVDDASVGRDHEVGSPALDALEQR